MAPRTERAKRLLPWQDRRGEFSPLKAVVFAFVFLPGLLLAWRFAAGTLGPRPWIEINHESGLWAVRLLLLTLAVTPLRYIWQWPELVFVRRTLGVSVFAYALIHLFAYAGDLAFDIPKVASEIVARIYLAIGFIALIWLTPLAITSTNAMMRRMGGIEWRRLHNLIYPVIVLATLHFFLQSKLGVTQPIVIAAFAVWLLLWRVAAAWLSPNRIGSLAVTAAFGVAMTAATGLGEAIYYNWKVNAALSRVLATNFVTNAGIRPAWIVAGFALLVILVALVRSFLAARRPKRDRGSARRVGNEA